MRMNESLTQAKDNGKLDSHLKSAFIWQLQTSADSLDSLMKPLSRMVQLEGMVDGLRI